MKHFKHKLKQLVIATEHPSPAFLLHSYKPKESRDHFRDLPDFG